MQIAQMSQYFMESYCSVEIVCWIVEHFGEVKDFGCFWKSYIDVSDLL